MTVLELKEILRERKLQTVGNKSELVDRLTNYDPNIWSIMNDERNRERAIDRSINEGEGSWERSVSGMMSATKKPRTESVNTTGATIL